MLYDTLIKDFPELEWKKHTTQNSFNPWWMESWFGSVYDSDLFFIYYSVDGTYKLSIMGCFCDTIKNTDFEKENKFLFTSNEIDYHTNRNYIKKILPTMLKIAKNNYIQHKKDLINEICECKY